MKPTLCLLVSSPMTVNAFLQEPIRQLARDYQIHLVCNGPTSDLSVQIQPCLTLLPVAIKRQITLIGDLAALWQLYRIFRKHSFDVVHSVTPKAGLLVMAAAFLTGVDIRIHTFTGQVWVTCSGVARWFLKSLDSLGEILFAYRIRSTVNWQKLSRMRHTVLRIQLRQFVSTGRADLQPISFKSNRLLGCDNADTGVAFEWHRILDFLATGIKVL